MADWFGVDVGQNNAFVPEAIKGKRTGARRSVAPLIALVDIDDPAFPRIAEALQDMRDAGVALDESVVSIAIKLGRQRHGQDSDEKEPVPQSGSSRRSIVYYIRRGDLIKIGTTANPSSRFRSLMPDEILAFEPGGPREEMLRHRQFAWCRVTKKGEYFRQARKLLTHVSSVRELHGAPDVTWPTTATIGSGYARAKVPVELPDLRTGEMATVVDGALAIGVSRAAIYGWARKGLLASSGQNADGTPLYPVEHLWFLKDRNAAWFQGRRWPGQVEASDPIAP